MTRYHRLVALPALLALALPGCSDDTGDLTIDAEPSAADARPIPPGFQLLVSRDWTIPVGSEIYRCTRVTVTEDMYITSFSAMAPLGTHHTVLSLDTTPSAPDGDYNCSAGSISHSMVFTSGVGTDDLHLPEGVAIPIRAGTQLNLNLHLFNVSDAPLTGTSGTLVELIPAQDVAFEAEVVFGGTYAIYLPPDPGVEQTASGGCTFDQDATVFALWPHMHQLGTAMKIDHLGGAGTTTLLDTSFSFEEQLNYPVGPITVNAGERLEVECTYINNTNSTVTFGDSSNQEMCFAGIYRYPASGADVFNCVGN